ncbi:hypothetical protein A4X13_0g4576 [Tilletia indica]|uniref:RTA1 like protein n=1 Tax=Tilletia indica TaxID=43049 RepID=A0A177TWH0_9BASI|nr:hypothetical protein A4X13_0g4576 [Tilletia indica]
MDNFFSPFPLNPKDPVPDNEIGINIYGYTPSLALGVVGCVVFFVSLVVHLVWLVRYKSTRTFEALVALTCLLEVIGYGARTAASQNPFVLISFILQYFFIVCAPIFLSAALYWALSVLIRSRAEYRALSPIGPKKLLAIFIFFDVATIVAQVVGAAFVGVSESKLGRGEKSFITPEQSNNVVVGGLAVQSAAFLVFLILFALFVLRVSRSNIPNKPSPLLVITLAGTALLIYLRTLFRLAESAAGLGSYIAREQVLFGVLETLPIMLSVLWLAVLPLGRFTDVRRDELGADGEKRV